MGSTTAGRLSWLRNRFAFLPRFVRRTHRLAGAIWVLSFALSLVVPSTVQDLPGPSIPGLSFIALVITGAYLLVSSWVRSDRAVADRLARLKQWDGTRPVLVRRVHRVIGTLLLIFIGIALALSTVGAAESPFVLVPIVGLLLVGVITGGYMFFRPWVRRVRAS